MATYKNQKIIFNGIEYILGDGIGDGGTGHVCAAKTPGDPVQYAVKFLTSKKDGDDYAEKSKRFLAELRFCEGSEHQNILKVLGHGEFNGQLCYIMRYCPKTLRNVINEEHDPFKLLDYSIQLCEAVKYIHDAEVIHRDIKPENIFLDNQATLLLADFGIAHFNDSTLTRTGDWLGNKCYAAPEQLVRGSARNITKECDIYAIGAIINELFTKVKPSGSQYLTVSAAEPLLSPLDTLVYRCLRQDPSERPRIDEVLTELRLLQGDLKKGMKRVMAGMFSLKCLPGIATGEIVNKACNDILRAKYIFERASVEQLEKYNCNYHRDIHYKVSAEFKNLYFQKRIFNICKGKFDYEARVYSKGQVYQPLDLNDSSDYKIYEKFKRILAQYKVEKRTLDISGLILKTFSACCNYHCEEIVRDTLQIEEVALELDDAPILYIVYCLRKVFSVEDIQEIDFINHVEINWETTAYNEDEDGSMYMAEEDEGKLILDSFEKKWGAVCSKLDATHYSVKFKEREAYEQFKNYALTLAKPYYIFEGDVLDVVRIRRENDGIVELEPWNSFDVTDVLAKILGLRTDY